jgi:glucokinase
MHSILNMPDTTILAVDVGGTNISCAIVDFRSGRLTKSFERRYGTRSEPSLLVPLGRFIEEASTAKAPRPRLLCVSGAGPVVGRRIRLTNAAWGIDAAELENRFGLRTFVINDFSAIAWGVLLLDPDDSTELVPLASPGGGVVAPDGDGPLVVLGAGTGLGFGFVMRDDGMIRVYPSEGGHISLPVYDDETRALSRWLEDAYGFAAGVEAGVSGQGIGHIFAFLAARESYPSAAVRHILEASEQDRPAMVSKAASEGEPLCLHAMDIFVRLYARFASDAAAMFLPSGGVYLAGGIAAKNIQFFVDADRFMESFGKGYREHIRDIAARTPVYIVKDYDISIYGAANAALNLSLRDGGTR